MLNRDEILNADNVSPMQPVEIPEWGGKFFVPVLSLDELDALSKVQKTAKQNGVNENAMMAVQIIRDETGTRVFDDTDAPALAKKRGQGKIILRVLQKFNEANGLVAGAAENAQGN